MKINDLWTCICESHNFIQLSNYIFSLKISSFTQNNSKTKKNQYPLHLRASLFPKKFSDIYMPKIDHEWRFFLFFETEIKSLKENNLNGWRVDLFFFYGNWISYKNKSEFFLKNLIKWWKPLGIQYERLIVAATWKSMVDILKKLISKLYIIILMCLSTHIPPNYDL